MVLVSRFRLVLALQAIAMVVWLAGCAAQSPAQVESKVIPVQHTFDSAPRNQLYQLSPDGSKLARLSATGNALNITVKDLATGSETAATDFTNSRVEAFFWASNTRLVFFGGDVRNLLAVDFDGRFKRQLNENGEILRVIHRLPDNEDAILVARYRPASGTSDILEIDLVSGNARRTMKGPGKDWPAEWLMTANGEVRGALLESGDEVWLMHFDAASGTWRESRRDPKWGANLKILDAPVTDRNAIALIDSPESDGGPEARALFYLDLETGLPGRRLATAPAGQCCDFLTSGKPGIAAVYARDSRGVQALIFDPELQKASTAMSESLIGRQIEFTQLDDNSAGIVIATSVLLDPDYYHYDFEQEAYELLTRSPDELRFLADQGSAVDRRITVVNDRSPAFQMSSTEISAQPTRQVDRTGISSSGGNP